MTDATQQRLLEAAEEIFAAKGFEAASIREICKQAGANVAAINYYFGDKERLYIETVKYANRACTDGAPFPEWGPDTPPVQKLRDFIRVMVTRMMTPQSTASLQLMMREMTQPTAACVEMVRDYIRPIAQRLGGILAEVMPAASDQERTLVAFSIVGQCHFYRGQRAVASLLIGEDNFRQLDVERVTSHITAFTLGALGLEGERKHPASQPPAPTEGVEA
jgi:AcrR family transcriptional regulator